MTTESESSAPPPEVDADTPPPGPAYIGPNWLQNGTLAFGCVTTAVAVYQVGEANIPSANLLALFLLIGSLAFLAAHLPGASGIWLSKEGIEMRETYGVTRIRWEKVYSRFVLRRRLLGTGVVVHAEAEGRGRIERHLLPRGVGRSVWLNMEILNAWLDRYGPSFDFPDDPKPEKSWWQRLRSRS